MVEHAEVIIDEAALHHFQGWEGPVGRSVERLGRETVFRQQALANRKTGVMAAGLHIKKGHWSKGIQFDAGSDVHYTRFVDQGTKPHKITAKGGGYLTFFWPKVGRIVHFKSVSHPGNKAYGFLMKGLERALGMWERGG